MKLLQKSRFGVQLLALVLTAVGFWLNFQVALMVVMLSTFFVGVFFCGWLCPYGTVQDLFSRLGKLLKVKKRQMPKSVQQYLKYSRYIIFLLVMFVATDVVFSLLSFDPRSGFEKVLLGNGTTVAAAIVMLSFALISIFFERPFCNYLCFEGAKYGLMSFFRPVRIKRNDNSCVNCKKCDKVCPMNIEISTVNSVESAQCINCMECVSACPVDNTLKLGVAGQRFSIKNLVVLLLVGFVVFNTVSARIPSRESQTQAVVATESTTEVLNGEAMGFKDMVKVAVTVDNGTITAVDIVSHNDDASWFDRAVKVIPGEIIETQSTDVDVVGGATYSSLGIIDAVKDALNE